MRGLFSHPVTSCSSFPCEGGPGPDFSSSAVGKHSSCQRAALAAEGWLPLACLDVPANRAWPWRDSSLADPLADTAACCVPQVGVCGQEGLPGRGHFPPELCHHQAERSGLHQHLGAGGEAVGCCRLRHPSAGGSLRCCRCCRSAGDPSSSWLPAGRLGWCARVFPVNQQEAATRKRRCLSLGSLQHVPEQPRLSHAGPDTWPAEVLWISVGLSRVSARLRPGLEQRCAGQPRARGRWEGDVVRFERGGLPKTCVAEAAVLLPCRRQSEVQS